MVNHFNFSPAPSVAERAKRRPPFDRMTEAKGKLALIGGTIRGQLDRLDAAVQPQSKFATAVEVDAAARVAQEIRRSLGDVDHWLAQYTDALSEQVGGQKAERKLKDRTKTR